MLLAFFRFQKFELLSNRVQQASCKSELCGSWGWSADQGCTEVKFTGRDKRLDYLIVAAGLFSKFILRRTHWDGEKFNEPFASDAACEPSCEFGSSSTGFWIHVYSPLARLSCNFLVYFDTWTFLLMYSCWLLKQSILKSTSQIMKDIKEGGKIESWSSNVC